MVSMDRLQEVSEALFELREGVIDWPQRYWYFRETATWNQLTSALDHIEDTVLAFEAYVVGVKISDDQADRQYARSQGLKYLLLYGATQALELHGDALRELCRILAPGDGGVLREAISQSGRQARNIVAGHPVRSRRDRQEFSYATSRPESSANLVRVLAFSNSAHPDERFRIVDVNLYDEIDDQCRRTVSCVRVLAARVTGRVEEHFREHAADQTLLETLLRDGDFVSDSPARIRCSLDRLTTELERRDLSVRSWPGLDGEYSILSELIETRSSGVADGGEILSAKSGLVSVLMEIDEDYTRFEPESS